MKQYVDKADVVAEIENLLDKGKYHEEYDCVYRDGNNGALYALKDKLDTLEVKDIDSTDAFIEKAVNYIANNMQCDGYTLQTKGRFIRNFKKYLEE